MPPRQPALPEGTDHIVAGASGSSGGQTGNGFVASAGGVLMSSAGWICSIFGGCGGIGCAFALEPMAFFLSSIAVGLSGDAGVPDDDDGGSCVAF